MARSLRAIVSVLCLSLTLAVGLAPPTASAQDATTPSTVPESEPIIPRPNSGQAPTDAGDRGGSLQTVVFVIVCAGVVLIGYLVVRESRAKRADRGF